MSPESSVSPIVRLARRPVPVLLGVVTGFLACCVAGRVAAEQQPFQNFVRFHTGIAPDSHYYPPFSQVLNLARERAHTGKILVVVGGNSILNGVGQREKYIWTRYLQEQLGDDFVVLNLALRGNDPCEFGGLVAERLIAEGVPVVFVTSVLDGTIDVGTRGTWDGFLYRYFFWDAWGKGLVPPDEDRDQWLRDEFFTKFHIGSPDREFRYRGLVDGAVYACDLWNTVAYCYLGTIWSPLKYPLFTQPHRQLPDPDPGETLPFENWNREELVPSELKIVRRRIDSPSSDTLLRGDSDKHFSTAFRKHLPSTLCDRTLFVLRAEGVYYRDRMTAEDQARYRAVSQRLPQALIRGGIHAQSVGENYAMWDYVDRSHFSEKGGRKLAADLAPTIRAMAAKLYGGGEPNLTEGQ
jgi:hypothetical protein